MKYVVIECQPPGVVSPTDPSVTVRKLAAPRKQRWASLPMMLDCPNNGKELANKNSWSSRSAFKMERPKQLFDIVIVM